MKVLSYIGVTGFTKGWEIEEAVKTGPSGASRVLMVGLLASFKSVRQMPMKEKWLKQTPDADDLALIFSAAGERDLKLIHYSTEPGQEGALYYDMDYLSRIGFGVDGFQLNLKWPPLSPLERYKEKHGGCIVLQVGKQAVEEKAESPALVARALHQYKHCIDAILLDPSAGKGVAFDTERARTFLREIAGQNPNLRLGVAGGLGPDTLHLVEPLLDEFPQLNFDAQGRLRDHNNELDIRRVRKYLDNAYAMCE